MAKRFIIHDHSKEAATKVMKLTGNGIIEFTDVFTENTKRRSPFLSGNNKSLIDKDNRVSITGNRVIGASVFSQSGYGGFLELGTSRMAAQPYFRPALDETIQEFDDGEKWGL